MAKPNQKSEGKGICWSSPSESASQHTEQVGEGWGEKQMVQHTDQSMGWTKDDKYTPRMLYAPLMANVNNQLKCLCLLGLDSLHNTEHRASP